MSRTQYPETTTYVCDRCGALVEKTPFMPNVWGRVQLASGCLVSVTWDLCDCCANMLVDWLRGKDGAR